MTDEAITTLAAQVGVRAACVAVGGAQAGYYRRHRITPVPERPAPIPHRDRHQPRALSKSEREVILDVLHSSRFADLAPAEGRSCSTRASTWGRSPRSTGCSALLVSPGNAAGRRPIRLR